MSDFTLTDTLVSRLLKWTRNSKLLDPSGNTVDGLDRDYVLAALNQGKQNIVGVVANAKPQAFLGFASVQITSRDNSGYVIPSTVISQNRVLRLDYAETDDATRYYKLSAADAQLWAHEEGAPLEYVMLDGKVLLSPNPSSGYLRFLAQLRPAELDIRRGLVAARTVNGDDLQTITLESDSMLDAPNIEALTAAQYVCVHQWDGTRVAKDVPVESYSSGVITVRSGYADPGVDAGMYVTVGRDTVTHCTLPREFEPYLMEWARWRILHSDASDQAAEDIPVLQTLREQIMALYAESPDFEEITSFGNFLGGW